MHEERACDAFGNYVYNEGHNGLPEITDTLTIEGNGARLERVVSSRFQLLKTGEGNALSVLPMSGPDYAQLTLDAGSGFVYT